MLTSPLWAEPIPIDGDYLGTIVPFEKIKVWHETEETDFSNELPPHIFDQKFETVEETISDKCEFASWSKIEVVNRSHGRYFILVGNWTHRQWDIYLTTDGYQGSSGTIIKKSEGMKLTDPHMPIYIPKGKQTIMIKSTCKEIFTPTYFLYPMERHSLYMWFLDIFVVGLAVLSFFVGGFAFAYGLISRNLALFSYSIYVFACSNLINFLYWIPERIFGYIPLNYLTIIQLTSLTLVLGLSVFFISLFKVYRYKYFGKVLMLVPAWLVFLIVMVFVTGNQIAFLVGTESTLVPIVFCIVLYEWRRGNPLAKILAFTNVPFIGVALIGIFMLIAGYGRSASFTVALALMAEIVFFSIILGIHILMEQTEYEINFQKNREYQVKFDFQGIVSAYAANESQKDKIQTILGDAPPPWKFIYPFNKKIYIAYGSLKQDTVQDMLTRSYVSGLMRAIIYFNKDMDDKDLIELMKNIFIENTGTDTDTDRDSIECVIIDA